MLKYYKNISKNVLICYAIALITFLIMFVLSYILLYNITPQVLGPVNVGLTAAAVIVVGVASYFTCMFMKNSVISSDKNICAPESLTSNLKPIVSFTLLMVLVGFGISLVGGLIFSAAIDLFSTLREDNFQLYCAVIKIPLFIGFAVFLAFLTRYAGLGDTAGGTFNPHLMLIALIFAFAFMMPVTVSDNMYDNGDNRGNVDNSNLSAKAGASSPGKIVFNVQTVFSKNTDLYKDNSALVLNEKFNGSWVVVNILLSTVIQIIFAMFAYSMGRKKYYKKHPHLAAN